jgi:hypothetical protein
MPTSKNRHANGHKARDRDARPDARKQAERDKQARIAAAKAAGTYKRK